MGEEGKRMRKGAMVLVALLVSLAILIPVLFMAFFSVGVGEVALLVDPLAKSVSEPVVGPIWTVKKPWQRVVEIYYATDSYEDEIPCFSSDQLEMRITVLMRWELNVSRIKELYQSFPRLNYEETAIDSIMEETIRFITKDYTALETIEHRDLIAARMQDEVFRKIEESTSLMGALMHLEFDLKNIAYPAKYTEAIEEKLVAEQEKLSAEFERERILILANATAQEVLIKASAESQAKIIVAEGTRQAIQHIMESAGVTNSTRISELYLWVEALKQLNVGTFIIVTGQDGIPIIYQIPTNSTSP